ncbi:hypothetical protein M501DRAFT_901355, partial [Patellaria atrata CBS 101060]
MYPHHSSTSGQPPSWNTTPPVSQTSSAAPNASYPPPPGSYLPPPHHTQPAPTPQHSSMASTYPPPHSAQQPYLPSPHQLYQDQYRSQPPPSTHPQYLNHQYQTAHERQPPQQPGARQRTAIACRYCRRRKIRCSGFDANEDGRCTNCVRFSQECVFTPVSAQTQAFVPAHAAAYRGNGPLQYFGPHGNPLPREEQLRIHQQQQQQQAGYALPSPTGPYSTTAPPNVSYPPFPAYDDRSSRDVPPPSSASSVTSTSSRKRPADSPHTPTLPPPNPATTSQLPGPRSGSSHDAHPTHAYPPPPSTHQHYTYPDPTSLTPAAVSPASSAASYHSNVHPPPGAQPLAQPYYAPPPPSTTNANSIPIQRRASPQSPYSYDPSRTSSSPHTQGAPSTPGTSASAYHDSGLRPLIRSDGRTPPPSNGTRPGISISSIVTNDSGGRSAADSDMLNALNRRGM